MKGQADFVEAVGRLRARYPSLYGVMCGPADKTSAYWRRLEGLVEQYGLGERLIIPGDVRPPLKDDLVAGSDIVVHPSHAESFGLAVLEAMAAGKPVVAAATDGPRLLIEDGVSGVLVEPGNVEPSPRRWRASSTTPGRRAALGARAAARPSDTVSTRWCNTSRPCGPRCSGSTRARWGRPARPGGPGRRRRGSSGASGRSACTGRRALRSRVAGR